MARAGISKFQVKKERDALVAQGLRPSIDAVRTALGNTGSRSTIHRYLRELDEEEGSKLGDQPLLSATLKEMVERLSVQLQTEAQEPLEQQEQRHAQQVASMEARLEDVQHQLVNCQSELERTQGLLAAEQQANTELSEAQHQAQIRSQCQEQEISGLKDQLASASQYHQSLEEKHTHAREALIHYRQSMQDLRDQDQRRHEQQLQQIQAEQRQLQQNLVIKQSEITELSKDNARLASELAESSKQVHRERQRGRELASQAADIEQRLTDQNTEITRQVQQYREELAEAAGKLAGLSKLEKLNAVLESKLAAQEELIRRLQDVRDAQQHEH